MTGTEFAEIVEWIIDRWGNSTLWANAHRFRDDFAGLDAADVWSVVHEHSRTDGSEWAPKPMTLVRRAERIARYKELPRIPARTARDPEWLARFREANDATPHEVIAKIVAEELTYEEVVWP